MLKLSLQRTASLWLLCLLAGFAKAQDVTATWNFTDSATVANLVAASDTSEAVTIKAIEDNGILLTVEAKGNAITKTDDGIETEDGVTFKVPVESNIDTVYVTGVEANFDYSIAAVDATSAFTKYLATDVDVANGYVEIVNKGKGLVAISVIHKEKPKPLDPPALETLTINGNRYAVEKLFGESYVTDLEIGFDEPMVSVSNPVTTIRSAISPMMETTQNVLSSSI